MAFDTNPDNIVEPSQAVDEELLELQKRKSVPAFVVSEFVADSDDEESLEDKPETAEEQFEKQ